MFKIYNMDLIFQIHVYTTCTSHNTSTMTGDLCLGFSFVSKVYCLVSEYPSAMHVVTASWCTKCLVSFLFFFFWGGGEENNN